MILLNSARLELNESAFKSRIAKQTISSPTRLELAMRHRSRADLRIVCMMNLILNSTPAAVKSSPKSWLPEAFRETISSPTTLELAMRRRSRADLRIVCESHS